MKICSKCKEEKPFSEFYKDKRKPDGLHYSCKQCKTDYDAKKKAENPRWHADRVRKSKYGISADAWNKLFAFQDFRCAICRRDTPIGKTGWHTDHDHNSGKVRGILCLDCNVVVGKIENGWPVIVPEIEEYLKHHSQ